MTALALLTYAAQLAPDFFRLVVGDVAPEVGHLTPAVLCDHGIAWVLWSGGTWSDALRLIRDAGACR